MPYIAFDLDALSAAPDVAQAAGIGTNDIVGGLTRMWAACWRTKSETVQPVQLAGFFGGDPLRVGEALAAFGFLAQQGGGFRVRGAEKYLKLSEGRRKGGLAARGNLKRGAEKGQPAPGILPAEPRLVPGSLPALSSNIQHPTSSIQEEEGKAPPPLPAIRGSPFDSGAAFFAYLQHDRAANGLVTERPPSPRELSAWFSEVMLEFQGDGERLEATVAAFAKDPYWLERNLPFKALMKHWRNYAPRQDAQ